MEFDLLVRHGNVYGHGEGLDVGVKDARIALLGKAEPGVKGRHEVDATGMLVSPSFIDPHVHLDKALISECVQPNRSGTLAEAIAIIWAKKQTYTHEDIINRAQQVIRWAITHGTTKMRTHVDVDTIGGLVPIEALIEVRKQVSGYLDLQIVAFPQEGIVKNPGADKLLDKALALGADVIGGMPYNEHTDADSRRHIDYIFELARKYDVDIDMHVDETDDPAARTLHYLAVKTIRDRYHGRVTAGHTCALAAYDDPYAAKVIGLVKEAGINMITNPATNLMLQGRFDKQPIRRGITRVKELLAAGVNVTCGQDCLKDTFYPTFGQADMLEVGMLTAHAAQFSMPNQIDTLFNFITANAAATLRLQDYGLRIGAYADFNVLHCPNPQEAFRLQPDRQVYRRGKLLASRTTTQTLNV